MRDENIKLLDFMCYHEVAIKEAVTERKISAPKPDLPVSGGSITDPTASQAMRNVVEIKTINIAGGGVVRYPERWLRVIKAMREWCKKQYGDDKIFNFVYKDKRKHHDIQEILHIDQSTFSRHLAFLRMYGLQAAAQERLVTVF